MTADTGRVGARDFLQLCEDCCGSVFHDAVLRLIHSGGCDLLDGPCVANKAGTIVPSLVRPRFTSKDAFRGGERHVVLEVPVLE